jgi:hypothetical protein
MEFKLAVINVQKASSPEDSKRKFEFYMYKPRLNEWRSGTRGANRTTMRVRRWWGGPLEITDHELRITEFFVKHRCK